MDPDGPTRRIQDYEPTRRIPQDEEPVTRRLDDADGVTRRFDDADRPGPFDDFDDSPTSRIESSPGWAQAVGTDQDQDPRYAAPADPVDPEPEQERGRRWGAGWLAGCALLGLILGVLLTAALSGDPEPAAPGVVPQEVADQLTAANAALQQAQADVAQRDARIAALEAQLAQTNQAQDQALAARQAALDEREAALNARSQALDERERALNEDGGSGIDIPGVDLPDAQLPDIQLPEQLPNAEESRNLLERAVDTLRDLLNSGDAGNPQPAG